MCVQWYHRCCDKPVDEVENSVQQVLCIIDGGLDLEFRTLSANVTESAAWLEVTLP